MFLLEQGYAHRKDPKGPIWGGLRLWPSKADAYRFAHAAFNNVNQQYYGLNKPAASKIVGHTLYSVQHGKIVTKFIGYQKGSNDFVATDKFGARKWVYNGHDFSIRNQGYPKDFKSKGKPINGGDCIARRSNMKHLMCWVDGKVNEFDIPNTMHIVWYQTRHEAQAIIN